MIDSTITQKQKQLDDLTKVYEDDLCYLSAQSATLKAYRDSITERTGGLALACSAIFKRLGWEVLNMTEPIIEGYYLTDGETEPLIVHLVDTIDRAAIADLTTRQMRQWADKRTETKPLLLLDAIEPNWEEGIKNMATNKGICLMTTGQLLACYVACDLAGYPCAQLRSNIQGTVGVLYGYSLLASEQGAPV
jgi:hypothetical protein